MPFLLAATTLPAEAAFQERDECVRTVTLGNGDRLRLGFNARFPDEPAEVRFEQLSLWAGGRPLPDPPRASSHYLRIDVEGRREQEGRTVRLDSGALLEALRTNPTLEISYGDEAAIPIGDGARIADEAERCMARSDREEDCSHIVRLEDGRTIRFEFRQIPPTGHLARAAAAARLPVSVRGSTLPLAGTRQATIHFSWPVTARTPFLFVHLNRFVEALRTSPAFELRNARDTVELAFSIPEAEQVARQALHCMALRDAGGS